MKVSIPIRTSRGLNSREHWAERSTRVRSERDAVGWCLACRPKPALPCAVLLTRIAPSGGLDDDNLAGSLKAVRDAFAEWIGVDDRRTDLVRYQYAQRRGPWGVEIEVTAEGAG